MNKMIVGLIVAAGLIIVGALAFIQAQRETNPPGIPPGGAAPIETKMLIRGAACQQDSDCAYALNAYPIQRCISPNCPPPEDPNQPVQGDSQYQWMDAYQPHCVNINELQNKNVAGEDLQLDSREHACECIPIPVGPNGERTSLTGQKICQEKKINP